MKKIIFYVAMQALCFLSYAADHLSNIKSLPLLISGAGDACHALKFGDNNARKKGLETLNEVLKRSKEQLEDPNVAEALRATIICSGDLNLVKQFYSLGLKYDNNHVALTSLDEVIGTLGGNPSFQHDGDRLNDNQAARLSECMTVKDYLSAL